MRGWLAVVGAELALLLVLLAIWIGQSGGRAQATDLRESEDAARIESMHEPGAERVAREVASAPAPTQGSLDASAVSILVSGSIRDRSGAAIPQASISFSRFGDWRSTTGAENGTYAMAGLTPGRWELVCRCDGFAELRRTCELDGRARQRFDLELGLRIALGVAVRTSDGKPLVGNERNDLVDSLSVVASLEALSADFPPFSSRHITRFGCGEFEQVVRQRAEREPAHEGVVRFGNLVLHREPPVYASLYYRNVWLQTLPVIAGQSELEFVLDSDALSKRRGGIAARIVAAENGAPIAEAYVELNTSQAGGGGRKTDPEGRVRIEDFHPGIGELRIRARDREYEFRQVLIRAGEVLDLGTISLERARSLAGIVVDAGGKPMPGARVSWIALDARDPGRDLSARSLSICDVDGRFTVDGLGARRYRLQAFGDRRSRGYALADLSGSAPAETRIVLRGDGLPISVRAPEDPLAWYVVTALDAAGVPIDELTVGGVTYRSWLDLPPGRVTIEIRRGEGGLL
ncbi:MAG: carboxypeptidase regulatory-like domain-containing protein, partial [Planctomycetes bacterium]|nr:carboxypeptidase regulatory-like domain-containing protein [Planctomycetota bacterium]